MRLITFLKDHVERLGAWIDGDEMIVDLAAAAELMGVARPTVFGSMQSLIDGGPPAWEQARALERDRPGEAVLETRDARVLAPLPKPIQIRDCLSFPGHLEGARRLAGERLIAASSDPAGLRAELEASEYFLLRKDYFDFPVYYISNNQSIVGSDVDVEWPAYSSFIDYELELAAIIGSPGRAISREDARAYIWIFHIQ